MCYVEPKNKLHIYGKNEMSLYVSWVVPWLHLVCCHARSVGQCCPVKHDNTVTVQWRWSSLADWVSRIHSRGLSLAGDRDHRSITSKFVTPTAPGIHDRALGVTNLGLVLLWPWPMCILWFFCVNTAFSALWQMLYRSICIEKYCTYYVKY